MALSFINPVPVIRWVSSGLLAASLIGSLSLPAAAQETTNPEGSEVRRVDQVATSSFSIPAADRLTEEANQAIASQQYDTAIEKLTAARTIYNDLSVYYLELSEMFFGVDTRQTRSNQEKALEAAEKRDQVNYQLALIYRTQDRPEEAVPLFMEVLRSQQPTRALGQQAYQQLFEMGFVEAPYEG